MVTHLATDLWLQQVCIFSSFRDHDAHGNIILPTRHNPYLNACQTTPSPGSPSHPGHCWTLVSQSTWCSVKFIDEIFFFLILYTIFIFLWIPFSVQPVMPVYLPSKVPYPCRWGPWLLTVRFWYGTVSTRLIPVQYTVVPVYGYSAQL